MQLIKYKGFNQQGRTVTGTLAEKDQSTAWTYLESIGIAPVICVAFTPGVTRFNGLGIGAKSAKRECLQKFCSDLSKLLAAGLPIDVALLSILQASRDQDTCKITSELLQRLNSGESVSRSLAQINSLFDSGHIQVIALGERVGDLAESFDQISDSLLWRLQFSRRIRSAVMYPCLVGLLLLGIMMFLVTTVVPSLTQFLATVDMELSWHTRHLLALSEVVRTHGFNLCVAIGLAVIIVHFLCGVSSGISFLRDRMSLGIPVYGRLIRQVALTRFTHGLSVLLGSRLDLFESLLSSSALVGNRFLRESLDFLSLQIQEGKRLSDAMRASGVFEMSVIQTVALGELSGDLETAVATASVYYSDSTSRSLSRLEKTLGPFMMCGVGCFIIWIIVSVVGPIYDAAIGAGALL